jgi:hypothetical protein
MGRRRDPLAAPHGRDLAGILRTEVGASFSARITTIDRAFVESQPRRPSPHYPAKADEYSRAMERGEFGIQPEAIWLHNGYVTNGHHRLAAVLLRAVSFQGVVIRGFVPALWRLAELRPSIDDRMRSLNDTARTVHARHADATDLDVTREVIDQLAMER